MKTLVISKPIYNNIFPLVDFPKNNDVFNIDSSIESITGEANVASYILGKYGCNVIYTGIIGNDEAGLKFKNMLESCNVDTKYMETDFGLSTDVTYSIINKEKGGFSHIKVNSMKNDVGKFKYDFTPDFIVFDDRDFSGANAALNNYPDVPTIFYGKRPDKNAVNMCKKADYIVCNINFVSKLTGIVIELNKPKTIVNLYQKLIDLYKGEWIITLGEHGVIYCNDNNVKMIPGIKSEVIDKDKASGVFFGVFAYAIVSGIDIENSVRLANIAASSSLSTIGATNGIMELDELLKYQKLDITQTKSNEQSNQDVDIETININNQNIDTLDVQPKVEDNNE